MLYSSRVASERDTCIYGKSAAPVNAAWEKPRDSERLVWIYILVY